MNKFKNGDKIRCIKGVTMDDFGRGEIVTVSKVDSFGNIIKIKEWEKKGYLYVNDWFELAEKSKKVCDCKFKVGEKVYRNFSKTWAKIEECKDNEYYIVDELGVEGWIEEEELETYIEPLYKVGEIIKAFPSIISEIGAEIVKVILNKKRKTYYYVAFCVDDGYAVLQEEKIVQIIKTKCSECGAKI